MDLETETNWTNNTKSVSFLSANNFDHSLSFFFVQIIIFLPCTTSIGSAVCEIIPLSSVKFGGIQDIKDKNHERTKNSI